MYGDIIGIRNIVLISPKISGKISVTALTPPLDIPKYPLYKGGYGEGGTPIPTYHPLTY
jgi:hypothetical protein